MSPEEPSPAKASKKLVEAAAQQTDALIARSV